MTVSKLNKLDCLHLLSLQTYSTFTGSVGTKMLARVETIFFEEVLRQFATILWYVLICISFHINRTSIISLQLGLQ